MKRPLLLLALFALLSVSIGMLVWHCLPWSATLQRTAQALFSGRKGDADGAKASTAPKSVDQAVSLVLGHEGDGGYESRWNAISKLSKTLSLEQREILYDFLLSKEKPENLSAENFYEIKNDLLNQLREQASPPPELTGVLTAMYQDKDQDPVIRDYAIQHLSCWYSVVGDKKAISQNLWQAAGERGESLSGTALLGLQKLSASSPEIDSKQVAAAALSLAQDTKVNPLTRITAVQVCGQMGLKQVSSLARNLADTSDSLPLRLSALATLGDLGGNENLRYLEKRLTSASNLELTAVSSAIQRARKRMQ